MLKNAYLDAKFGFDTAENEPSEVRGFLIGVEGVICGGNEDTTSEELTSLLVSS